MIAPVIEHVTEVLGDVVYGIDVETVEERVHQLLDECGRSFALAESCTGGQLAERYTELPGASRTFLGGVVTYTNEAKIKLLGIDPAVIEAKTAVSEEVAVAMAEHVRALMGADIGIGVTGHFGYKPDANPFPGMFDMLKADGTISGGMLPKVESCCDAIRQGVKKVHLVDGRMAHSLLLEIFTREGVGTEITE